MHTKRFRNAGGGEISIPYHKTVDTIKSDWADMIRSGELTLGEPCAPYTLTNYVVVSEEIQSLNLRSTDAKSLLLIFEENSYKKA